MVYIHTFQLLFFFEFIVECSLSAPNLRISCGLVVEAGKELTPDYVSNAVEPVRNLLSLFRHNVEPEFVFPDKPTFLPKSDTIRCSDFVDIKDSEHLREQALPRIYHAFRHIAFPFKRFFNQTQANRKIKFKKVRGITNNYNEDVLCELERLMIKLHVEFTKGSNRFIEPYEWADTDKSHTLLYLYEENFKQEYGKLIQETWKILNLKLFTRNLDYDPYRMNRIYAFWQNHV